MPDPKDGMSYPNRTEEDQDVDMQPVVVGPGAYASPDPDTENARLLPLNEHPMAEQIAEDYGKDAMEAGADAGPATDEENGEDDSEEDGDEIENMTVAELDDKYQDEDGYPKSGNKDEKVAFAREFEGEEE